MQYLHASFIHSPATSFTVPIYRPKPFATAGAHQGGQAAFRFRRGDVDNTEGKCNAERDSGQISEQSVHSEPSHNDAAEPLYRTVHDGKAGVS